MRLVWPAREYLAGDGVPVEEFIKPPALGGTPDLRFRIALGAEEHLPPHTERPK